MQATDIIAAVGAIASVASFTPQAWRIIRARKTEGLSAMMFTLTVLAFACWMTFGLMTGTLALAIANAICLLFALFILVMILLPERKTAEVAEKLDPKT